jgi:hypothetical protein
MEESIDREIRELPVGKVSKIVESSMGIHLFFIENVSESALDELYKDKELYEQLYSEKKNAIEEKWYELLMKDSSLKTNPDIIKEKVSDGKVVIQYKSKKITRKDFFTAVDQYRQGYFPEATYDDLVKLMKSMALDLVMEDKALSGNIIGSSDFKKRMQKEKDFLIISDYVDKNVSKNTVDESMIREFYDKNKSTLFTFKQLNGRPYIQPLGEVRNFIIQKIEEKNKQDARYALYKKLVDEEKVSFDDKALEEFKKKILK